jgi:hypothetical protein
MTSYKENIKVKFSKSQLISLPVLEILTFAFATWLQGYLVTDSFDLAFLLLPEFEIEYFEASLENHGFDHLKKGDTITLLFPKLLNVFTRVWAKVFRKIFKLRIGWDFKFWSTFHTKCM